VLSIPFEWSAIRADFSRVAACDHVGRSDDS